ncbi:MAG: tRNA (N(6)-L-threonylcarbamoyladenosine(37)-C(2))-methylthiotransferase MtaB [SAR324 cluster bacterium]|nr:tRNA (N(6)-L-threonylcarbamoyladenosine(37)-C(2))-methylthiotransferase MtaB [SAR324 cluster bacterium]
MSLLTETASSTDSVTVENNEFDYSAAPANKRVSFHTIGCRLNQSETETLSRSFEQQGYTVVAETAQAEVCVINTCTVTEPSDAKNRQLIRTLHRKNPAAAIAVVGCYAQINPEEIAAIEGVNLVIGSAEKMQITDYLSQIDSHKSPIIVRPKINKSTFTNPVIPHSTAYITKSTKYQALKLGQADNSTASEPQQICDSMSQQNTRASLKIQDGCDFMCSFCIIPFARGRSRYREFQNLQEEARMLLDEGVQEIVITGVNVGTYKTGKRSIVDVIDFLNTLPGLSRIRISSIEPTTVPEILFQYMSDPQHKLVPFFHLPLQSGSDIILSQMKRRYTATEYADEIWRAFESVPDLCLGTDVMVGFPEENEAEFESTLNLLNKLPLTYFHVFPFSTREGTPAFRMEAQINPQVKQRRGEILRSLSSKKRRTFNQRFLAQTRNVLWEARKPDGTISGYTDNYIRVVLEDLNGPDLRNQLLRVTLKELKGQNVVGVQSI